MKKGKRTGKIWFSFGTAALTALGLWLASPAPALAGPCGGTAGGSFSENVRTITGLAPCTLDGYSRKGSAVTLTVPVDRGGGTTRMICDGGASHAALGGWVQDTAGAGQCIYKICYETGPSRPPVTVCENISGGTISVSSTPVDLCMPGTPEHNATKNFCVFDTASPAEITGATGDDMVRIKAGAKAYFESLNLAAGERLKWVQWISPDMSRDLMMPSGPLPTAPGDVNAYKDLKDFLTTPPAGVVAIEPACYAVAFDACTNPPPPPPVAGLCGPALGSYYATSPPAASLCYIGNASTVSSTETEWRWTCSGERGGATSEVCKAYKPVNGQCGAANGHEYGTAAEVAAAGLCAKGAASPATPSGSGPWSWTCSGTGGGTSASCSAQTQTCSTYLGSMVLVQDLSGSFAGDLPYMQSQMQALVDDPEFQTRKLGLSNFIDDPRCAPGCVTTDYTYRKDMNLVEIGSHKSELTNTINTWGAGNGGDSPEAQWIAIKNALNDFGPQSTTPLTLILSTDASAHSGTDPTSGVTYPTTAEIGNLIKSKEARLIILYNNDGDTVNVQSFYQSFLSTYGIEGAMVPVSGNSENFLDALKTGLTEICH